MGAKEIFFKYAAWLCRLPQTVCHACARQVTALTNLESVHWNPSTNGDRCRHATFQGMLGSRTQATCENVWLEVAMKLISGAVVVVALWPHREDGRKLEGVSGIRFQLPCRFRCKSAEAHATKPQSACSGGHPILNDDAAVHHGHSHPPRLPEAVPAAPGPRHQEQGAVL